MRMQVRPRKLHNFIVASYPGHAVGWRAHAVGRSALLPSAWPGWEATTSPNLEPLHVFST